MIGLKNYENKPDSQGDCRTVLKEMPNENIDLIFADPPYNLSGKSMEWKNKGMGDWFKVNESGTP